MRLCTGLFHGSRAKPWDLRCKKCGASVTLRQGFRGAWLQYLRRLLNTPLGVARKVGHEPNFHATVGAPMPDHRRRGMR
jgi:hypothetical protein